MSTRDVAKLRQMCSALTDCCGFNSNGWLKSHAVPQIATSKADFYVKRRRLRLEGDRPAAVQYHGDYEYGGRFGLFSAEYFHMMENLKM